MRPRVIAGGGAGPWRGAVLVTAATLALGPVAGCTATDNQHINERSRLASDLAGRLTHSATLSYTATYDLPGGARATLVQAQQPQRVAFAYPGGKVVLTPSNALVCRPGSGGSPAPRHTASPAGPPTASPGPLPGAGLRCTLGGAPSSAGDMVSTVLSTAGNHGLVAPATVVALLGTAALDLNASIDQRDTTIAGENATCVDVHGLENASAASFSACITAGGLLGSFQGTLSGTALDVTLDQYDEQVATDAFDPPAGATVG